jgi:hypothetical protein
MKKIVIIYIVILFNNQLYSQYKEGYIITNSQDTVFGFIKFEGSFINSNSCTFKKDIDDKEQIFTPENISAFRFINSKYFVSRSIKINDINKKVFLEWLIKGKASILSYCISLSIVQYYLTMDGDSLIELKNTIETIKIADQKFVRERHEYIGLLNYYFHNAGLQSRIMNTKYNSNSLIDITKSYHDKVCKDEKCLVFEDENRKVKFCIGFVFSSIISQPTLNRFYNSKGDLTLKISETVNKTEKRGLGITVNFSNLPIIPPNFSFQTNFEFYTLIYKYSLNDSTYQRFSNGYNFYYVKLNPKQNTMFSYNAFRFPIQIRYSFLLKKIQPYVSIGFTTLFRWNIKIPYPTLISHLTNYERESGREILGFQYGLNGSIGLSYYLTEKLGTDISGNIEQLYGFFGGVDDKSTCLNYLLHFGIFYKF